jgi:hypothetical protein
MHRAKWKGETMLRMATGRIRIERSVRAPKTETQTKNLKLMRTPIRMKIHPWNQNPWILETHFVWQHIKSNEVFYKHMQIYTHIQIYKKMQQIVNNYKGNAALSR